MQAVATPPYRKRRNLLVTLYHFLCRPFVVYAQDTLKDYKEVDLHGARQGVVARRGEDCDVQDNRPQSSQKYINVHTSMKDNYYYANVVFFE